ncbi:MAG: transglycosylase domain-containing protein, partial [Bdellovibrionales bacterium]|nr:transglycosylase domain-containing protein [Bdellovibrionales bacterium]
SIGGILRALVKNIFAGKVRQGGSTITQQLVKNYFLTPERTLRRKLKEFAMAILLESRATKDEILETYVNEIYMGQNGVFQVRGHGAASLHYFGKPLADLNLSECALLAAIINSPGKFNPFLHPEDAMKRRTRVLDQMKELNLIDEAQHQASVEVPLPNNPKRALSEPAPFFVDAVRARIAELEIPTDAGLRVFTTLDLSAQEAATQAVKSGVERLEAQFPKLKKNKEAGERLEGALVSADPLSGFITAIVGGRNFRESQFNRAIRSKRQIGSLMKPIVYLSALESLDSNAEARTPLTLLEDQKRTFTDHGQKWTPENYDGVYHPQVPMFFALKSSLNVATAQLGIQIGLDGIVDLARRLGVSSRLEAMPSLTLGAFEMTPVEVLQIYSTLARFGNKFPLTSIERIESLEGENLYQFVIDPERVVSEDAVAVLVGMMKHTLISGTARGIFKSGFVHPAAGKTGTTSDYKDSWFAGFTPYHVAITWVGYDSNKPSGLTGGSGAAPLWTDYMKNFGAEFPAVDFRWPETTEMRLIEPDQQRAMGVPDDPKNPLAPVELVFVKGTGE